MLAAVTSAVFFGISYASPCIDIPVAQVSLQTLLQSQQTVGIFIIGRALLETAQSYCCLLYICTAVLQNPFPLGPSVEVTFVPSYPGESILYGSGTTGFPQLWCASNTTYSAYGVLFFKPIDEVLSIMIQFQVGGRTAVVCVTTPGVHQHLLLQCLPSHVLCLPHSVQARRDLRSLPPGEPYGECPSIQGSRFSVTEVTPLAGPGQLAAESGGPSLASHTLRRSPAACPPSPSAQALALMFGVAYIFMVATYGTAAPTGLFIPALVVGASGGRLLGRGIG